MKLSQIRRCTKPTIHDVTFDLLLPYVDRKLGPHHIRTKLYLVPSKTLNTLFEQARDSPYLKFSTAEYRLNSVISNGYKPKTVYYVRYWSVRGAKRRGHSNI
jgi:hypothetical protein